MAALALRTNGIEVRLASDMPAFERFSRALITSAYARSDTGGLMAAFHPKQTLGWDRSEPKKCLRALAETPIVALTFDKLGGQLGSARFL